MSRDDGAHYLDYLFARMMMISRDFHREMSGLLSPYGRLASAPMKGFARAIAKCYDGEDGYQDESIYKEPCGRYLKDLLRCSLFVKNHQDLVDAHTLLTQTYRPAGTKNRREIFPRDVLQVVWFQGILVEVQFHFDSVVCMKQFSHTAYNVARVACIMDAGTMHLWGMYDLFDDVCEDNCRNGERFPNKLHW